MISDHPSLLVVPPPIDDESPASWLLRISEKHHVSCETLLQAFGIKMSNDPDISLRPEDMLRIGRGTGVPEHRLRTLGDTFSAIRQDRFLTRLLVTDKSSIVKYRFCRECLRTDPIPYFRIQWRFLDWKYCPIHRIELSDHCGQCGCSRSGMSLGRISNDKARGIRTCHRCRHSLAALRRSAADARATDTIVTLQRHVVTASLIDMEEIDGPVNRCVLRWYLLWYVRQYRPEFGTTVGAQRPRASFLDIGDDLPNILAMYKRRRWGSTLRQSRAPTEPPAVPRKRVIPPW
ncbi:MULTISPECIES: TniQ family protein [Burkholderia cepacia complex]|uniref:TniQ family protein n=1 Tax=Burkholderia cepacia complex TaxID=87882 RepID=UPI0009BDCDA4|nr:TniQ family protein [Burkholderia cepacia]MCW3641193.1 TniQ family protein [Burkholderia cenocepacia]MDR8074940.1 TniQ family protein [Burkholderia cenocepacia]RQU53549.1 hypothetical protein DF143_31155 [Burkholderia cenocepacia]RQV32790.1 hypothetical protein DF033_35680 [Burkholderia cenocepacia]